MLGIFSLCAAFVAVALAQPPSCPPGTFCASEYPINIADTCGVLVSNTSSSSTDNNISGNYTWTNATNTTVNATWTLQDTLIDKSIDISSQYQLGKSYIQV